MIDKSHQNELNVSRETLRRLNIYNNLLNKWQRKTNLIAPSTIGEFWTRHVADSVQCFNIKPDARHWVDLGSGGGFPGLVIGALLAEIPNTSMTLVESNHKKSAFLRTASREMNIGLIVRTARIEDFVISQNAPEVVTARAVTSLDRLLDFTFPWLAQNTIGLFHKGREYRRELEESRVKWRFDLIEYKSKIAEDSVVLEISNLKKCDQV